MTQAWIPSSSARENLKMSTKPCTCYECDANCPIEVEIDALGEPIAIKGPDCPRCYVQLDRRNHPERLLYPLKRVGPRGSGQFERISWDEALDTIAARLTEAKAAHGAPAVAFFAGYTKEARPQLQRLAHAFGSPNYLTESGCCFSATMVAEKVTFGYKIKTTSTVISPKTRCHLIWSTNPRGSIPPFDTHGLVTLKPGRRMIVVDPRRTPHGRSGRHPSADPPRHRWRAGPGFPSSDLRQRLAGSGVSRSVGERGGVVPRLRPRFHAGAGRGHLRYRRGRICARRSNFSRPRRPPRSRSRRPRPCSTAMASRITGPSSCSRR